VSAHACVFVCVYVSLRARACSCAYVCFVAGFSHPTGVDGHSLEFYNLANVYLN
jgi:hypothetical protein